MANWLQNNSDLLLAMGGGLLGGRTAQEQSAGLATNVGTYLKDRKQRNATTEWLKANSPDLVPMLEAGMSPADLLTLAYKQKQDTLKAQQPNRKFQKLDDGTYGWADESTGSWTPLGKAEKPSDQNDVYGDRRAAAEANGLTPDNPAYQSFVLTGKMPREDQSPLTATDKKAILEADEMVLASKGALPLIDRAITLNDQAYDGATAGMRGLVSGAFGSDAGLATQELNNVVLSQALGQLKSIFGAAPTEGERKILLEVEGSVDQPAPVRKAIFERAKAAAERRMQFYQQRADEIRGGSFYQPNGGTSRASGNRTTSGVSWSVEP